MPPSPQRADGPPIQMVLVVPDGCHPGSVLSIPGPDGVAVQVTVSAGVKPGQRLAFTLPWAVVKVKVPEPEDDEEQEVDSPTSVIGGGAWMGGL